MSLLLGVDAGASKTRAIVADERGVILGAAQAGSGNHQVVGLEPAIAELARACGEALAQAGASSPVELAFMGLAGADLPVDYALLTPAVEGLGLARQVVIKNDTMIALRAGLTRSWGVAVVCGTGFNAGGIGPDGREVQLAGLGRLSGDWGGGSDIAHEAIYLVSRAWDGRGRPTALTQMVLSALDFASVEEMISEIYQSHIDYFPSRFDPRCLLDLVSLVFEAAYQGDDVAQELVKQVGTEVGITANAIVQRLGLQATGVEVVLSGSVFKGKGPLLLDTVTRVVHCAAPRATIIRPELEPVAGAILLALERWGAPIEEAVYANLRDGLESGLARRASAG